MIEIIKPFLDSYIELCPEISDVEIEFLKSEISISNYKKKEIYLNPKFVQKEIGFLYRGLIRTYYLDDSGKEITTSFLKENDYVADYLAFIKQVKTKYYFECLEACIIVNLPYSTMQKGYKKYKVFEKYGRLVSEKNLEKRINRIDSFLFQNAENRYLNFIKENPQLIQRIKLTHLSSYLGIERQSLTRIRKKTNLVIK